MGAENEATGDSKLNDSAELYIMYFDMISIISTLHRA